MSTIGIIILIFYILGCVISFWISVSNEKPYKDYLTLNECLLALFLSLFSWLSVFLWVVVRYGDEPFIKFKK